MLFGSLEKMQIHLKIETGSVQCLVQLEGLILSTRVVRQDLNAKQCLFEELEQTNLSFDSDVEEVKLYQSPALEHGNILIERGYCSIDILQKGEAKLHLNSLERVNIDIDQELLLFPGVPVQRKDTRFRWKGIVLEIMEDRKLAQVDWGISPRWHSFRELHLLDELGNPILDNTKTNIFQAAIRGRKSILIKPVITKILQSEFNSENLSQNNINISIPTTKKEFIFQVGDLVKHADPYHLRGNNTGIIELCTEDGEYIIWWQSDNEDQIAKSFRTFCADELILIPSN